MPSTETEVQTENIRLPSGQIFLWGFGIGFCSYLLSEFLVPRNVPSPADHDLALANRLGFIFPPAVGLWLGWLQRSPGRAGIGFLAGVLVGLIYLGLSEKNFLAVMVGFPCLCGGVFAGIVGSNRDPWISGLPARVGKGLVAGLVLGFVYMVVLNVVCAMVRVSPDSAGGPESMTASYIATMWKAGPVALGVSGGLFLILVRWAIGSSRIRLIVFEEVDPPDSELGRDSIVDTADEID